MINQNITHYHITEKIGEGGMGEVYLAEDTRLKRKVALKFLPEYLQQDEVAQRRFLREAQSAATLDNGAFCSATTFVHVEHVRGIGKEAFECRN